MKYETPTIDVVGTATELIQGSVIQGNDNGAGSLHGGDFSSKLEEN
jgi:hypothetical protein